MGSEPVLIVAGRADIQYGWDAPPPEQELSGEPLLETHGAPGHVARAGADRPTDPSDGLRARLQGRLRLSDWPRGQPSKTAKGQHENGDSRECQPERGLDHKPAIGWGHSPEPLPRAGERERYDWLPDVILGLLAQTCQGTRVEVV